VREYDRLGSRASWFDRFFISARLRIRTLARELYPPDTAPIALGILTGDRTEMPDELRERFTRAGLSHLLVVSGFNVAVLALALSWLLGFLPLAVRTLAVCLAIGAFVLLVGLDPPVVRAGVSGVLVYLAIAVGRSFRPLPLLSAVALVMLLFDPVMLALDPSFQLSFLAVAGLVLSRDFFTRIFRRVPASLGMRESLAITFAALVATFPVTTLSFGQISLVAPISNLLAAPLAASATVL
jgi:competence protein ComEC